MPLTDEEAVGLIPRITTQWLAGFFDGEGCITGHTNHTILVDIAQADIKVLALINLKYPEARLVLQKGKGDPRPCGHLRMFGNSARRFLVDIEPFAVAKRAQVEKAIELLDLIGPSGVRLTTANKDKRMSILAEIKDLKRKV